jgi:hypothetical protein
VGAKGGLLITADIKLDGVSLLDTEEGSWELVFELLLIKLVN